MFEGYVVQNLIYEYKSISLGKRDKSWKSPKPLSLYSSFPIGWIWSLPKFEMEPPEWLNIGSSFRHTKFSWRIQSHVYGKEQQTLGFPQIFLPMLDFLKNLFWSLSKNLNEWMIIGSTLCNAKLDQLIQNHARQILKLSKNLCLILKFPITFFSSLSKPSNNSFEWLTINPRL